MIPAYYQARQELTKEHIASPTCFSRRPVGTRWTGRAFHCYYSIWSSLSNRSNITLFTFLPTWPWRSRWSYLARFPFITLLVIKTCSGCGHNRLAESANRHEGTVTKSW